jgi:hypothetical protein
MSRNFYFLLTKAGRAVTNLPSFAPVAQLDRAPGFEPVGRRFESCRARHWIYGAMEYWNIGVMPLVRFAPSFHCSNIPLFPWFLGPVAQLVEQLTLNQLAEGSSPSRPTSNIKGLAGFG